MTDVALASLAILEMLELRFKGVRAVHRPVQNSECR